MFDIIIELVMLLAMFAAAMLTQNTALTIATATAYLIVAIRNMVNER